MLKQSKLWQLAVAFIPALLVLLWVAWFKNPVQAQSGLIVVDKQLGRASHVVYVGEYLTFTIRIHNDTPFTITLLPLQDQYNAGVLAYQDANVVPDQPLVAGQLTWSDLTTQLGNFPPGREETLIVGFIAEHPQTAVVNQAWVDAAVGENGEVVGGGNSEDDAEAIGGSAPLDKAMLPGLSPQVGDLITFTITLTNTGYITMTRALLVDTYNSTMMAFSHAVPMPDIINVTTGVLTWTNVAAQFGGIPGNSTVHITTMFTATKAVTATLANHAEIVAAGDWYSNAMAGGADDVPITIIERPAGPTPTPAPPLTQVTPTPARVVTATPAPVATATPMPTWTPMTTPTPIIPLLPQSGPQGSPGVGWLLGALLLVVLLPAKIWRRP